MSKINVFILTVTCLLSSYFASRAQIKLVPISKDSPVKKGVQKLTKSHAAALELPFWDDFSNDSPFPDTALWVGSQNVKINKTLGKNSLTIGVASFDGLDAFGTPYNLNAEEVGFVDSLVSKPIDLTLVSPSQSNTVFLSFYYQKGGNGEFPDSNDFIQLEFLTPALDWMVVWPDQIADLDSNTNTFNIEVIQIPDSLFHDQFQFRFRSFGRQSGPFDNWNLDYILLNKGRNANDIYFPDRALTSPLPSILVPYTAYPIHQFKNNDLLVFRKITTQVYSLEDPANIVQAGDFSAFLRNRETGTVIDTLNYKDSEIFSAQQFSEIFIDSIDSNLLYNALAGKDSMTLEMELFINTNDKYFIESIDPVTLDTTFNTRFSFAVNDTIRNSFILSDFQAYDDGSAEFGAGINQIGGKLAYKFVVSSPDTLVSIDMYFPNISGTVAGTPINLLVFKDLDEAIDSEIHRSSVTVQSTGLDQFGTYTLSPPIIVQDTFFIGFEQNTNQFIPVGLDHNTNTGRKIYFNVEGVWEENTEVIGSLMIRPRFGNSDEITAINETDNSSFVRVYPNPSRGKIYIEGEFDHLYLKDLMGRKIPLLLHNGNYAELNFPEFSNGLYLLEIVKKNKIQVERIIISR